MAVKPNTVHVSLASSGQKKSKRSIVVLCSTIASGAPKIWLWERLYTLVAWTDSGEHIDCDCAVFYRKLQSSFNGIRTINMMSHLKPLGYITVNWGCFRQMMLISTVITAETLELCKCQRSSGYVYEAVWHELMCSPMACWWKTCSLTMLSWTYYFKMSIDKHFVRVSWSTWSAFSKLDPK